MSDWLGKVAMPPDAVAWTALGCAVVCLVLTTVEPRWLSTSLAPRHHKWWVGGLAALAAALSVGYIAYYLRGGPRIVDATSYWLQARALADGWLTFPVLEPSASFRGRFLLAQPERGTLGVIFPPGYPAVLAVGFLIGAPLAVGPLIAAGLVAATHALARAVTDRDDVALLAAALSAVSAVLRYHTADTMSHAWCALLGVLVLLAAFKASTAWWIAGGVSLGWLWASRPATALAYSVVLAVLLARQRRAWVPFAVSALPGVGLLLVHQHAVTGQWLASSQQLYYALGDGPPGCFDYGFGRSIGCLFEHGDHVRAVMPHGYYWREAAYVTFNRLFVHLRDAGNLHPLAAVIVVGGVAGYREPRLLALVGGLVAIVAAYVPFYYDGSYPGGGARLYVDALPLEHVLLAQGFFLLRAWRFAVPLALFGFATQTARDHLALARREGGRPMFEPAVLARAAVTRGLVFVGTDHGFNLGFDPARADASTSVIVARYRGDANDHVLWERLGRPPAYRYLYKPSVPDAVPTLESYALVDTPVHRFEAEHEWPAFGVEGGWVHPNYPACASRGRGLQLHTTGAEPVRVTLSLLVPAAGRYDLRIGWSAIRGPSAMTSFELGGSTVRDSTPRERGTCWVSAIPGVTLAAGRQPMIVRAEGEYTVLDYVELAPSAE